MRVFRDTRNLPGPARGAVVALGNFDGVHRGHQALIAAARGIAGERRLPLAVMVFEPYPREFFRPDGEPFRLTSLRTKAGLLAACGVDLLIVLHFDARLASMLAQDFVMDVLVKDLAAAHIVVGEDFRFGKSRGGDAALLGYMGEMEGFGVTVFPPLADGPDAKISSSRIRAALKDGRPEEAARLLGHPWSIEGHVAPGDRRGRTLGFPTANLTLQNLLHPAFGVYAVRARRGSDDPVYDGMANFGRRPTFAVTTPLFETHLFDFSDDIYGQLLHVELIAYLRPERKFASLEELQAQLVSDSSTARKFLARAALG
jgi:riboflavin kinase / FMN adenylyltransferase